MKEDILRIRAKDIEKDKLYEGTLLGEKVFYRLTSDGFLELYGERQPPSSEAPLSADFTRDCSTCAIWKYYRNKNNCGNCKPTGYGNWQPAVKPVISEPQGSDHVEGCTKKCKERGLTKHDGGCAIELAARKAYEAGEFDNEPSCPDPRTCYEEAIRIR